ncbi:kinesin family member 19 [Salpingoeca rosetta]|uniref:Kinesin-like protein KIN-8B n=1 Tax=Salpingoeca rosetta (strain ATCC 50818 / BSB-021) TaxID=946362 RepID=F2U1X7_SALR5|nr:kinesin family member 19 [Salpingoeca rosetta]EGD81629.1 kinesin family member 19 [Salpingoeca rosetta]|eukprot:XP_004996833.1 kinesin family member 19 [Salpingoeca rosetta]
MMGSHPQRKKRRDRQRGSKGRRKRDSGGGGGDVGGGVGGGGGGSNSDTLRSTGRRSKLTVCVRVRPRLHHEVAAGRKDIARVVDEKMVVLMDPHDNSDDILRRNRSREKRFAFDTCFDSSANQKTVYTMTTKPIIKGVLNGYNATVFAYGPTGSGKTYTMLGNADNPGIMTHTLRDLFKLVARREDETEYRITMTYVELYNEYLYDLLVDDSDELELREDAHGNNHVIGATEVHITQPEQVLGLLMEGNRRRTQEATAANSTSSRSHAILCIRVRSTPRMQDIQRQHKLGQLYMCDLAGSERAAHTKNIGQRMVEGQHINRSLLALGNCINSLGSHGQVKYVNYRDSKLTRLLKHALGGNCRTVMIAHISPCDHHFEESYNTLTYANRAKNIKTRVTRNAEQVQAHVTEYTNIISSLKDQIATLQRRLTERKKSAPPRPRSASGDSRRLSSADAMPSIVEFQLQLDQLLKDQLDLFEQLHDIRHKSLEVVLDAREQTTDSLLADNVFDLDIYDESSDSKQVLQVVTDQVDLARDKLKRLEDERQAVLSKIDAGRSQALQLLKEAQTANSLDEEAEHVLSHLHGLFDSKLALASAESSRTSLQQYLMETSAALEQLQRQTVEQSHIIRQQARLLAEHGIELPVSLQLEQRKSIADQRVAAAIVAMDRDLPLMCLDPEEIIRRRNAQRVQPKRLHDQLRKHYANRMKTISNLGFSHDQAQLTRSTSLTGIHRGSLIPGTGQALELARIASDMRGDGDENNNENSETSGQPRPMSKVQMRRATSPIIPHPHGLHLDSEAAQQQEQRWRRALEKKAPITSTPLPGSAAFYNNGAGKAGRKGSGRKRSASHSPTTMYKTFTKAASPMPLDRTYTKDDFKAAQQRSSDETNGGDGDDTMIADAYNNDDDDYEDDFDDDFDDDDDDDDDTDADSDRYRREDARTHARQQQQQQQQQGASKKRTTDEGEKRVDETRALHQHPLATNNSGNEAPQRNTHDVLRKGRVMHAQPTPVAPQLDVPSPRQLRVETAKISPKHHPNNPQVRRGKQLVALHPTMPRLTVQASPYAIAPRHLRRGGR